MFIDDILEFEGDSNILEYQYIYKNHNITIWPYFRSQLIFKLIEIEYGVSNATSYSKNKHYYYDFIKYNPFRMKKNDILFINPSSSIREEKSGELKNVLLGSFIEKSGTNVAECITRFTDIDYKRYKQVTYSVDEFITCLVSYEEKRNKLSMQNKQLVEKIINYLKKEFPYKIEEGVYVMIKRIIEGVIKRFPSYYKYYYKLLDIVQPKIVFLNCAMYGNPVVKVMNDYGILTAEFQHGVISKNHPGYSYSKKFVENEKCRSCMPKYFLSYHDYWTKNINIPSNIYKIGNPVVQKNIYEVKKYKQENNILIITDYEPIYYEKLIYGLLECFSEEYKIVVKIHPSCPKHIEGYKKFFANKRVEIKLQGSIYKYIHQAKYIIGDGSTAMYEAAALGKTIFVHDRKETHFFVPDDFGIWIKNAKEMKRYIQTNTNLNNETNVYFDLNWEKNYCTFLRDIVGIVVN